MQQTQFNYNIDIKPQHPSISDICRQYNPDFHHGCFVLDTNHADFKKLPENLKHRIHCGIYKYYKTDPLLFMNDQNKLIGWIRYTSLIKESQCFTPWNG